MTFRGKNLLRNLLTSDKRHNDKAGIHTLSSLELAALAVAINIDRPDVDSYYLSWELVVDPHSSPSWVDQEDADHLLHRLQRAGLLKRLPRSQDTGPDARYRLVSDAAELLAGEVSRRAEADERRLAQESRLNLGSRSRTSSLSR
jgi:hypothetical protein